MDNTGKTAIPKDTSQAGVKQCTLTEAEYQKIVIDWNKTDKDYPKDKTITQLFEAQVAKTPDNIAAVFEDKQLTYAELNIEANQLARYLRLQAEIKPDTLIALCLDRSLEMIVGILGIMKAGGAYVPIDPQYPATRIQYILDDTKTALLLTQSHLTKKLQNITKANLIALDSGCYHNQEKINLPAQNKANTTNLAYVIYTSGTTGQPKGVMIEHRNVVNTVKFLEKVYTLSDIDNVTQFTAYVFDVSVVEIFTTMTQGACLHILPNDVRSDLNKVSVYFNDFNITYAYLPPVLLAQLPRKQYHSLKTIIYAGEPCDKDTAEYWCKKVSLFNIYGPTESTIYALCKKITHAEVEQIGRPINNTRAYILGIRGQPVPIGVTGELHIGGAGVARGYLNKPELTQQKFIANPFATKKDTQQGYDKLYKTGDLVRWLPDGNLQYIGRNDFQVKIRGYRIELGEIENALTAIPSIKQACVLAKEKAGNKYLVAYYVLEKQHKTDKDSEVIDQWENLYDSEYAHVDDLEDITQDFSGWSSYVTGKVIPIKEMQKWQADIINRINAFNPNHMLEIGVGSGLIMYPLLDKVRSYTGLDFSGQVITRHKQYLKNAPCATHFYHLTADRVDEVQSTNQPFDCIVMNSVCQYFPSIEYFEAVITKALQQLSPAGHLFIGDVRDYCLHKDLIKERHLYQGQVPTDREIEAIALKENELLIAPAYFLGLANRIGGIKVDILERNGEYYNELSQYRYDVIIRHSEGVYQGNIHTIDDINSDHVQDILEKDHHALYIKKFKNWHLTQDATQIKQYQAIATKCHRELKVFHYSEYGKDYISLLFCINDIYLSEIDQSAIMDQNHLFNVPYLNKLSKSEILSILSDSLPDYMIPNSVVEMDNFPLTVNGKLDRKALPDPEFTHEDQYVAPTTDLEVKLCEIWQEVLGLAKIGITDDFFKIGGNSIIAIHLVHRIAERLNINLHVVDIFENSHVAKLAACLEIKHQDFSVGKYYETQSLDIKQLHFLEELILLHQVSSGESLIYNESFVVTFEQHIDVGRYFKAAEDIVAKYEILSSHYILQGEQYQRQLDHHHPFYEHIQLNDYDDIKAKFAELDTIPFNLAQDALIRFYLIDHLKRQYIFVACHHVILDATSLISIILPELYYRLADPGYFLSACADQDDVEKKQPITAFIKLSKSLDDFYAIHYDKSMAYWTKMLTSCEIVDLAKPISYASHKGSQLSCTLNKAVTRKLYDTAKTLGVSLYSLLFAVFSFLIHRVSSKHKIAIRTNIDERAYIPSKKDVVGCFINNTFITSRYQAGKILSDYIKDCHDNVINVLKYPIKYSDLLGFNRDLVEAIADIHFNIETEEITPLPYEQTQIYSHSGYVKEGLYFELDAKQDHIYCRVEYQLEKYDDSLVRTLMDSYEHLLVNIESNIVNNIAQISILPEAQYQKVVIDWNKTDKDYPKDKTIHQLFEVQVKKTPNNIAVVFENKQLSYAELNTEANQLARYLQSRVSIKPDTLIVLCLDRSLEMIIGILGVLKAGGAYVPIDPEYSKERIQYILDDTKTQLLLTQSHLIEKLENITKLNLIALDSDCYQNQKTTNLPAQSKATTTNLAYVIYTSGTTGKPKGVMIEHGQFSAFILNFVKQSFIDLLANFNVLSLTNYTFDIFGLEFGLPLSFGNCIYLADFMNINHRHLQKSSIIQQTPHVMSAVCDSQKDLLKDKLCLVGGEHLPVNIAEKLLKSFKQVVNVYGPSETVIWSSCYQLSKDKDVLIGQALFNEKYYVLDIHNQPVPIGVTGELHIGGAGVARGYLNNSELTRQKFINNPFATKQDTQKGYDRLYKTGDLVRWLPDGNLEYIGRNDSQVKIRGFRIELGEIENALTAISGIKQNCVLAKEKAGNKYLVAYYVTDKNIEEQNILDQLGQKLPDYMVPSTLVKMDSFPLTVNGKLDSKALPDPEFVDVESYVAPTTDLEVKLCEVWQEVLELEKISITDDFFKIGGHSILAIKLIYHLNQMLKTNLSVADIFKHKTIASLAQRISGAKAQPFTLVKPYYATLTADLPTMIMIHPGFGGSEVYQGLADKLSSTYNCVGIDNYNMYFDKKISSLPQLAQHYLDAYERTCGLINEPIYLLGWSLGGQIALEMAHILQQRGCKDIHIYLLDTVLQDAYLINSTNHQNQTHFNKKMQDYWLAKGYEADYIDKILQAAIPEAQLIQQQISGTLCSKVTLFKALQQNDYFDDEGEDQIHEYIQALPDNNIGQCVQHLKVVNLACHHWNIVEHVITNDQYSSLVE